MLKNSSSKLSSKPSNSAALPRLYRTSWQEQKKALSEVRRAVFIEEQKVPEALEWDGLDATATHVLAVCDEGSPVGCGRLLPDSRIGRIAVLQVWRGRGIGRALLQELLAIARQQGMPTVSLSSQTQAIPFYEQAGFSAYGPVYMDAGIPHRNMSIKLTD
jgi:predicted GNAT family N-acyltransferase